MGADHTLFSEFAVHMTPMTQTGPPPTGQWARGDMILDVGLDLYVCTQASTAGGLGQPAIWKQVGGGGGPVQYVVENLSAQVNGITFTFTTTQARAAGKLNVFLNGQHLGAPGTLAGGAHVEEINNTTFKIDLVPQLADPDVPGDTKDELHVSYMKP